MPELPAHHFPPAHLPAQRGLVDDPPEFKRAVATQDILPFHPDLDTPLDLIANGEIVEARHIRRARDHSLFHDDESRCAHADAGQSLRAALFPQLFNGGRFHLAGRLATPRAAG